VGKEDAVEVVKACCRAADTGPNRTPEGGASGGDLTARAVGGAECLDRGAAALAAAAKRPAAAAVVAGAKEGDVVPLTGRPCCLGE
jgi:hypothetical protein